MKYVVVCKDALPGVKDGVKINTCFAYDSEKLALEHKASCDNWDKLIKREPSSYIISCEDDELDNVMSSL